MIKHKKNYTELIYYILATFIAICGYKILILTHLQNTKGIVAGDYGVIEGKPYWLADQNRLLGPYLVFGISTLFGISFKVAWAVYHAFILEIFCILIFWILRREGLSPKDSISYLIYVMFAFLALQFYWFFTWDSIDLILFTIFAYGIIKSYSISFFLVLFFIGILNRESALFIGIYLMLDSLQFTKKKGGYLPKFVNPKKLIIGLCIIISGIVYTRFIRNLLFVDNSDRYPATITSLAGNHFNLFKNLKNIFFYNFNTNYLQDHLYYFVSISFVSISMTFPLAYFFASNKHMNNQQIKLYLMSLIILANIMIFGIVSESRLYLILIPFFLFLWLSTNNKMKS
jgi:hypothetical protein